MIVKCIYLLSCLTALVYCVQGKGSFMALPTTTASSHRIHWSMKETSYSAQDKYHYIQECVKQCMTMKMGPSFSGRDNCLQSHCRLIS